MTSFGSRTTFLHLEFGIDIQGAAPLGDVAATLITLDDLLRDLAALAAYPSDAEFRNIEVVAIETRERLKVTLSLLAIPADAITAFQDVCRDIIVFRERADRDATLAASAWQDVITARLKVITAALNRGCATETDGDTRLDVQDGRRLQQHMDVLRHAAMPLRRVEVLNSHV